MVSRRLVPRCCPTLSDRRMGLKFGYPKTHVLVATQILVLEAVKAATMVPWPQ